MDQARMANSNSSQDNSDDLIAELARLMAQDAQGEAPQKNSSNDHSDAEREAPADSMPKPEAPLASDKRSEPGAFRSDAPTSRAFSPSVETAKPEERAAPSSRISNDNQWATAGHQEHEDVAPGPSDDDQAEDLFSQLAAQLKTIEPSVTADQNKTAHDQNAQEMSTQEAPQDEWPDREPDRFAVAEDVSARILDDGDDDATIDPAQAMDPIAQLIAEEGHTEDLAAEVEREAHAAAEAAANEDGAEDSFDVAPVIGLAGSKSAERTPPQSLRQPGTTPTPRPEQSSPAHPAQKDDPISEIEALIGEAVRAGWKPDSAQARAEASVPPAQMAAPGGLSARAEPTPDPVEDAAAAVEAAISAAAFSSKQNKWTPSDEVRTDARGAAGEKPTGSTHHREPELNIAEPRYDDVAPRRSVARFALPAAALVLLLSAGAGGYWYFTNQPASDGEAPVLAANTEGAKVAPPVENTTSTDQQSVVFSELNKTDNAPPPNEQIVSRDQSANGTGVAGGTASEVRQVGAGTAASSAAATPADGATSANQATQAAGTDTPMTLTNRKVRTVTVLPDGTIVSEDTAVAGNQVLPVERPNVPALPGTATTGNDTFQVASAETAGATQDPAALAVSGNTDTTAMAQPLSAADGATLDANAPYPAPALDPVTRQQLAQALPAGPARPTTVVSSGQTNQQTVDLLAGVANQAVSNQVASSQASAAPAAPAAPAASTATANADNAAAYVQLSSQRTPDAANTTLTTMNNRYGNLFAGNQAFVKAFDLGDRGTFYRVLVPASSLAGANQICDSIKNAGGDCFVRNP